MTNLQINFEYPWLLLLLIPAIFFTLLPYFRVAKKYRRTRNRVTSIVLHATIMVLCIAVLSGMSFTYNVPNSENEVMLVVDSSFSSQEEKADKDDFVKSVINNADSGIKVGVVTFGFNQVYAAELTTDARKAYNDYINADLPDDSATDVASALTFARDKIHYPQSAKIILLTDGIETDGNAITEVRKLAAEGIKVDTVYFPADHDDSEIQIIDVAVPDYNIKLGDTFEVCLTTQSTYGGMVNVTFYDTPENGESVKQQMTVDLEKDVQTITLNHSFSVPGLHELCFEIKSKGDTLEQNNVYYSYIYQETFDQILIIERNAGESEKVEEILKEKQFNVKVANVTKPNDVPITLDELRAYDQIILVNISNEDIKEVGGLEPYGFIQLLNSYVYEVGGGLFTVGGNKVDENGEVILDKIKNPIANAYNKEDMEGAIDESTGLIDPKSTLYQQMLPVQAVDYTPPLGVMIIIDRSGSMDTKDNATGKTVLELAKEGAISSLNALTERDWCGVMTLEDSYDTKIKMTRATQRSKIVEAIDAIEVGGGTNYAPALDWAGRALSTLIEVEKKHIILVTDGQPNDKLADDFGPVIQHNYEQYGVTMSLVVVGNSPTMSEADMTLAAEEYGHGHHYRVTNGNFTELSYIMREDLTVPEIKNVEYGPFIPVIRNFTSVVHGVKQEDMPELSGFYGTKLKEGAEVTLMGEYVPIYAQWKYGKGMVGSFMCDLNGYWSEKFVSSPTGKTIIYNIVNGLFPTENIRPKTLDAFLTDDNYTTHISVYTDMQANETIEVTVISPQSEDGTSEVQTIKPKEEDGYSRIAFTTTKPGVYEIIVQKKDAEGKVVDEYQTYKAFSYSEEYNMFIDPDQGLQFVTDIAHRGKGAVITNPVKAFDGLIKSLYRYFDPSLLFIIISIVLFLLDVAVRKFKFKWPHEIIREYKAKKNLK